MRDEPYSFGAWVRRRRKALDLTQALLARLVGVAAITVQKIEADARRPSRQVAELLAAQLQVPERERAAFLAAARGERAADLLHAPRHDLPGSAGGVSAHLPVQLTSFLGRAGEIAELTELLQRPEVRLLTLTGAGGSGKTRLALRVAEARSSDYPDGVWFVDLAPMSDPSLIAAVCLQALGIPEMADVLPLARLQDWLRVRTPLLILDNYEHVLGVVIEQAAAIAGLRGAPAAAARLWGAAEALREEIGAPIWPVDRPRYVRRVADAQALAPADAWGAAWLAGRALIWEQAADEAWALLEGQLDAKGVGI